MALNFKSINLKDQWKKIVNPVKNNASVTNPLIYLNPVTLVQSPKLLYKNLSTLQKERAAKKAAQAGVSADSLEYTVDENGNVIDAFNPDGTKVSVKWPTWAVATVGIGSVVVLALTAVAIVRAVKRHRANK